MSKIGTVVQVLIILGENMKITESDSIFNPMDFILELPSSSGFDKILDKLTTMPF